MGKNLKGREIGKGLSQRKSDGIYQGRITINGKTIYVYDKSLKNCSKKLEEARKELLKTEKNQRHNITLTEWFEEWFNDVKKPTLKNDISASVYYRKVKNTFISVLGEKQMDDITQMDIQRAANELVETRNANSVREALCVLKEVFEIAVINGTVESNVCVQVKVKNENTKEERRYLNVDEEEIFLQFAKNDYFFEIYQFLLLTGLRISELSGLTWDDIDFNNKKIKVERQLVTAYENGVKTQILSTPKTGKAYREVPFFDGVEETLISWKKKQDERKEIVGDRWRCDESFGDLVFTTTMGSPVTRYTLAPKINRLVKEINCVEIDNAIQEKRPPVQFKSLHPHAFRHTFATRCLEKNLNTRFVQEIMGHSNYGTTASYSHISDNFMNEQVIQAGNLLR